MPVALVTDRWDPNGGGRERYAAALGRWLTGAGHEVTVFSARSAPSLDRAIERWRAAHPAAPVLTLRPAAGATHYLLLDGLYRTMYAAERASLRSRVRRACYWPALRLNRRRVELLALEQRMLASAPQPRLMVCSPALRDRLRDDLAVPPDAITVEAPGIDLARFTPGDDRPASGPLRLLFVAHDFELKGLGRAVEAVATARRFGLDARLTVAGRGRPAAYRRMAARLAVPDEALRFAGDVTPDDLAQLYRGAHALLHPSLHDAFGLVVIEALASGCPVIVTRACGASAWIEHGRQGFVIGDPADAAALAAAVRAVADRRAAGDLGRAAARLGASFGFPDHAARVGAWLGLGATA